MCVYVYCICVYVYMHVYVYVCICMCLSMCTRMFTCVYACMHMCTLCVYLCMCTCIYMCTCVYVYLCRCVCMWCVCVWNCSPLTYFKYVFSRSGLALSSERGVVPDCEMHFWWGEFLLKTGLLKTKILRFQPLYKWWNSSVVWQILEPHTKIWRELLSEIMVLPHLQNNPGRSPGVADSKTQTASCLHLFIQLASFHSKFPLCTVEAREHVMGQLPGKVGFKS